jgi:hypothetical protein
MQSYNNVLPDYDISAARFAHALPQQRVSSPFRRLSGFEAL